MKSPKVDQTPWPPVSNAHAELLTRLVVPYARWIRKGLIEQLVIANMTDLSRWQKLLREKNIEPDLYLWTGSACAYPGIRRKNGKTETVGGTGTQSLALDIDGNALGKRAWGILAHSANSFKKVRKDYELVHLFPHKADEWGKLLDLLPSNVRDQVPPLYQKQLRDHGLPGLFSNPANTCFLPSALVRPTDGDSLLRRALWVHALDLYGVATLLPPELAAPLEDWLRSVPLPDKLEWSKPENHHGEESSLVKLIQDQQKHFKKYDK